MGISEQGALILKTNNEIKTFMSGDVSVRFI
jgi:biotin-(acetyl-CoA carboxylase) ligase